MEDAKRLNEMAYAALRSRDSEGTTILIEKGIAKIGEAARALKEAQAAFKQAECWEAINEENVAHAGEGLAKARKHNHNVIGMGEEDWKRRMTEAQKQARNGHKGKVVYKQEALGVG